MRDRQIMIEPFEYVAILDLQIDRVVNEHTKATLEIRISDDKKEKYMESLLEETWVHIRSRDDSGNMVSLFYGVVTGFTLETGQHESILSLEMISGTFLMDIKEHFRTFQNPDMTYETIHAILGQGYEDCYYLYLEDKNKAPGHFVIQHRETDWAFLKRLAAEAGGVLTAEGKRKGIRYYMGIPEGEIRQIEEGAKVRIIINTAEYLEKKHNGMAGLTRGDCMEVVFEDRELYEIGDTVLYGGRTYVICKIESRYRRGECLHTYYLRFEEGLRMLPRTITAAAGCSFDARVTAIQGDKVKVDVWGDENGDRPERRWLVFSTVYSSPDGTGWYCMPEIGDQVQIHVPEKEGDTFVVNAVHVETSGGRINPDHKSFKNRYGKEILLTPDRLLMTNNRGLKVELSDGKGIFIESNKDIAIRAGGDLQVSSQSSSLLIAAEEQVAVTQGGTTMTLKEEIKFSGGQFRMQ